MASSRGFGSGAHDSVALFRLAFAPAPRRLSLSLAVRIHSPVHSSIGTPSGWPKPMPSDCLHVGGFRISFTPLTGVLFTVPSRYSSAIGRGRYLALEGGPPCFRRPSTGAAVLPIPSHQRPCLRLRASHPLRGRFPVVFRSHKTHQRPACGPVQMVVQPHQRVGHSPHARCRFRLFPVRSPLLGESLSFPRGTKMFQFPRFPPPGL